MKGKINKLVLEIGPKLLEAEIKLRRAKDEHINHACPIFVEALDALSVIIEARLEIERTFCARIKLK